MNWMPRRITPTPAPSTQPQPQSQGVSKRQLWSLAMAAAVLLGADGFSAGLSAQTLRASSQRWLDVREARGSVTYLTGSGGRPAKAGDRLTQVGQGIRTGAGSSAIINVDDGIGIVRVSENTNLTVSRLSTLSNGGKVTEMNVTTGQARLQVRRFNNPSSRLQIQTPAGVAAVRGTEFGVTVSSLSGKLGMATTQGAVEVSAQNQTVLMEPNQYSTINPGEPPTPPQVFNPNSVRFDVQQMLRRGSDQVQIQALTDPPNLLFVNGQPLEVAKTGLVEAIVPIQAGGSVNVLVRNPIGVERVYQLVVP
ncbi:MAG: FecR family protein [Prochlorothrix sp.]